MLSIYRYIDIHVPDFIDGLKKLLAQPTISTKGVGILETAELLQHMMEGLSINTKLIETKGFPIVFGEFKTNSSNVTLLIYGHYDVQPPEPLEAWVSPPFEPTIRGGRIFARGAGDNKGQLYTHLMALKTYLEVCKTAPVNIKFLFEGEEEKGSPNLETFVIRHRDLLDSNLVYTSDGPVHESGRPIVAMGARGLLYLESDRHRSK